MNSSAVEQTETTKNLLLNQLKKSQRPMSLQQLESDLAKTRSLSHRTLKEAAWKLVEEGKVKFNSTWDLEIL
ncbi:hypothetical protein [Myxosarcina sp. GI1(2024)]